LNWFEIIARYFGPCVLLAFSHEFIAIHSIRGHLNLHGIAIPFTTIFIPEIFVKTHGGASEIFNNN
jgi:hypothetical protein